MEEKKTTAVEMTAEQLAAFEAFQQEQAKKERQQKRKENRLTRKTLCLPEDH